MKKQSEIPTIIVNLVALLLASIWLTPIVWSFVVAFKPKGFIVTDITTWFVPPFTLDSFRYVLGNPQSDVFLWTTNSVIVATSSTLAIIVLSLMAAFVFAKFEFKGKNVLFWTIMAGMMIPFQSLVVPIYTVFQKLGMLNSLAALILPYLGSSFAVILLRQFIASLPNELFEAARIDGCGSWRTLFSVVLPLVKPAISSLFIYIFLQRWNDFLWPFISVTDPKLTTLPLGIAVYKAAFEVDKTYAMAANVLAILPILIVFLVFQKNIIKGVTLSGIKG